MANYLKPQSPLQHKDGDYFYPLTTIDQIITKDNTRLNAELINVNLDDVIEGTPNKINADTLQGYTAEDFFNSKSSDIQLNYSVVSGLTEPSHPTENMIWVQTDQPITNHIFSKKEPTGIKNLVWFKTADNSEAPFSNLKIQNLQLNEIYPIFCKIFINNNWIDVTAQTYQNGKWVKWAYIILDKDLDNTNGWIYYNSDSGPTAVKNTDGSYTLTRPSGSSNGYCFRTNNAFNLTDYNILEYTLLSARLTSDSAVGVLLNSTHAANTVISGKSVTAIGTFQIDISALTGDYAIAANIDYLNNSYITISDIKLKR